MNAEDKELIKDIKLIANGKESTNQDEFLLMFIKAVLKKYHQRKVNEVTDEMIDRIFQLDKNILQSHQLKVLYKRKGAKWLKEQLLKQ